MSDLSYFESRTGKLTCSAEDFFAFVTDARNFERFVPKGTINAWHASKDYCSFNVSMIGTVAVRISEMIKYSRVVFEGDALKKNDFSLTVDITDNHEKPADIKISLSADLNPMMKMMAPKPINNFLEILVDEMENFGDWKKVIE